jgi:hypothetical protein
LKVTVNRALPSQSYLFWSTRTCVNISRVGKALLAA